MKRLFLLLTSLTVFPLSGCALVARSALQSVAPKRPSAKAVADSQYISSLKPDSKSGPGVVIFDPVVAPNAKSSADLGTGIGRYLHFYVAGQGAFGKTTTLGHMDEVRRQYKLANWRVPAPTDATRSKNLAKYVKSLGATHYAVGKIDQKNDVLTVSYSLYGAGNDKARASWKVSAPSRQIAAKLPALAKQIAVSAKAKSPVFPAKMTLSSDDLAVLGAVPFLARRKADKLNPSLAVRLARLGQKDALAAILAIRSNAFASENAGISLAQNAVKMAPGNALAISEPASSQFSETVTALLGRQVEAFNRKYPANALGHHAAFWQHLNERDTSKEIVSEERAVRSAMGNAYFWRYLSVAQGDDADAVRNGRYSSDVTAAEWSKIDVSYARALGASMRAVQLDRNYSFAWSRLSTDSTFLSDSTTAFDALERALAIDGTNKFAWVWGEQITQPKWFGSKQQYIDFSKRAAACAMHFDFNSTDTRRVLTSPGDRRSLRDILEIAIKADPQNATAISDLGQYYHYDEANYPRAEALYHRALTIAPNDGNTNSALGDITLYVKNDAKTAEKLYLKAIASNPRDAWFYGNLGRLLAQTGRKAEAMKVAQKAKQLGLGKDHPVWEATGVTPP